MGMNMELGIQNLWLFIVAGLLLNITPGPDMLYIAGRTLAQGMRGGMAAILGINAGCLVHTFAAAIGLSALLTASAEAFFIVKWVGALYLFYVGVTLLREQAAQDNPDRVPPVSTLKSIFWQGFLTNVLNPKVALFYLALLPQFIAADAPNKPLVFMVLGLIFIVNSMVFVVVPFAWLVARAQRRVRASNRISLWLNRTCGALFVGLGIKLALTDRPA
jgi:threonine/homoserine/homoserine lactone efflux protein